jgi:hypothetical protein
VSRVIRENKASRHIKSWREAKLNPDSGADDDKRMDREDKLVKKYYSRVNIAREYFKDIVTPEQSFVGIAEKKINDLFHNIYVEIRENPSLAEFKIMKLNSLVRDILRETTICLDEYSLPE